MRQKGFLITLVVLIAVIAFGVGAYSALSQSGDDSEKATQTATPQDNSQAKDNAGADVQPLAFHDPIEVGDFDLANRRGEMVSFKGELGKNYTIVNFWATWCPYCVDEMQDFQNLYDVYGDSIQFTFIDVTDGYQETVEDATDYIEENGFTFPVYFDTTGEAIRTFEAYSYPTTAILDFDGRVVYLAAGRIDTARFDATLAQLTS